MKKIVNSDGEKLKNYPPPSLGDTLSKGGQEKGQSFALTDELFMDYRLGKLLIWSGGC